MQIRIELEYTLAMFYFKYHSAKPNIIELFIISFYYIINLRTNLQNREFKTIAKIYLYNYLRDLWQRSIAS